MNISLMRGIVRRDLHDEDAGVYRWTDDEIDRHIAHAVTDLSAACPRELKTTLFTVSGAWEIDISSLAGRVYIAAVEYPIDKNPREYRRFTVWGDTLTLRDGNTPDGGSLYIYYGALHLLTVESSTLPAWQEETVAAGAGGYAALEWAIYAINRVNTGGRTPAELAEWGRERLSRFRATLKRLDRKNRVRERWLLAGNEQR